MKISKKILSRFVSKASQNPISQVCSYINSHFTTIVCPCNPIFNFLVSAHMLCLCVIVGKSSVS